MEVLHHFSKISALICEPSRSKMLWFLLDGKAYTASEIAAFADISITATSNHLSKLLEAEMLKVEIQGRHRYYTFANAEVAYVIESLAQLSKINRSEREIKPVGIKFCRTCYDHLAGFVGVQLVEALEKKDMVKKSGNIYLVTNKGWEWFENFGIKKENYNTIRRPLTRQCLDWSERKPHLAGQLGADWLMSMFHKKWFKKVQFSRELVLTARGRKEIYELLGVVL
ncbi:Uncharacterized HTH-type transcriptional regulator YdfF [Flavobacterium sp. 9AF]|uniref:ArsR/SmtB family transcription factor n=1 Tax=Flavobacterium sp. 9AF TaxID=2653142 RepID=UPI0012F3D36C|nr:winged helix-turn-helix domain-containing protein [Flavobacterium sp. 9AF]VXB59688.1 Uncharacterized HTH-type transcriptional regulator YdfF [Flavobacterium sp. 9AF]